MKNDDDHISVTELWFHLFWIASILVILWLMKKGM